MIVLDCDTRASTLKSIADIYGIPADDVAPFFREATFTDEQCGEDIRKAFEDHFGTSAKPIDRVFWFHFTRARDPAVYKVEGLRHLEDVLPGIWETIFDVFRDPVQIERLERIRDDPPQRYKIKHAARAAGQRGPFSCLLKEPALAQERSGNYRYLRLPEIMEDICNDYKDTYEEDISHYLSLARTPCVVKFWTVATATRGLLEDAMSYLYFSAKGKETPATDDSPSLDFSGPIPAGQVTCVDTGERVSWSKPPWPEE